MKYLDLHGDRVAYRDAGVGEELLLIDEMAGSSPTWGAGFPELSKMYRVVAPDLLGHRESAKPRGDYSLGAFSAGLRDCSMNSASPWRQWLAWRCRSAVCLSASRLLRAAGDDQQ